MPQSPWEEAAGQKSPWEEAAGAKPKQLDPYPELQPKAGVTIGASEEPPLTQWLTNLKSDVMHGTTTTGPGKFLHGMGATGLERGVSPGVANVMGGELIGPAKVAHALSSDVQIPQKPGEGHFSPRNVANFNELASGIFQSPGPGSALIPGALPAMALYGPAGAAVNKGSQMLGASPEQAEAIQNATMLGAPLIHMGVNYAAPKLGQFIQNKAPTIGKVAGYGTAGVTFLKGVRQGRPNPLDLLYASRPAIKAATGAANVAGKGVSAAGSVTPPLFDTSAITPSGEVIPTSEQQNARFGRRVLGMKTGYPTTPPGTEQTPLPQLPRGPLITPPSATNVGQGAEHPGNINYVPPVEGQTPGAETEQPPLAGAQPQVVQGKGGKFTRQFTAEPTTGTTQVLPRPANIGGFTVGPPRIPPPLFGPTATQPVVNEQEDRGEPESQFTSGFPPQRNEPLINTPSSGPKGEVLPPVENHLIGGGYETPEETKLMNEYARRYELEHNPIEAQPLTNEPDKPIINTGGGTALSKQPEGLINPQMSRRNFLGMGAKALASTALPSGVTGGLIKAATGAPAPLVSGITPHPAWATGMVPHALAYVKATVGQASPQIQAFLKDIGLTPENLASGNYTPEQIGKFNDLTEKLYRAGDEHNYSPENNPLWQQYGLEGEDDMDFFAGIPDAAINIFKLLKMAKTPEEFHELDKTKGYYQDLVEFMKNGDMLDEGEINHPKEWYDQRKKELEEEEARAKEEKPPEQLVKTPKDMEERGIQDWARGDLERAGELIRTPQGRKSSELGERYFTPPWEHEPPEGAGASHRIGPDQEHYYNPFTGKEEPDTGSAGELNDLYAKDVIEGMEKTRGELIDTRGPKWEVFDPKDGKPIASYDTEAEARAHAESTSNLDYAKEDEGFKDEGTQNENSLFDKLPDEERDKILEAGNWLFANHPDKYTADDLSDLVKSDPYGLVEKAKELGYTGELINTPQSEHPFDKLDWKQRWDAENRVIRQFLLGKGYDSDEMEGMNPDDLYGIAKEMGLDLGRNDIKDLMHQMATGKYPGEEAEPKPEGEEKPTEPEGEYTPMERLGRSVADTLIGDPDYFTDRMEFKTPEQSEQVIKDMIWNHINNLIEMGSKAREFGNAVEALRDAYDLLRSWGADNIPDVDKIVGEIKKAEAGGGKYSEPEPEPDIEAPDETLEQQVDIAEDATQYLIGKGYDKEALYNLYDEDEQKLLDLAKSKGWEYSGARTRPIDPEIKDMFDRNKSPEQDLNPKEGENTSRLQDYSDMNSKLRDYQKAVKFLVDKGYREDQLVNEMRIDQVFETAKHHGWKPEVPEEGTNEFPWGPNPSEKVIGDAQQFLFDRNIQNTRYRDVNDLLSHARANGWRGWEQPPESSPELPPEPPPKPPFNVERGRELIRQDREETKGIQDEMRRRAEHPEERLVRNPFEEEPTEGSASHRVPPDLAEFALNIPDKISGLQKQFGISKEIATHIMDADPTENKSYAKWIALNAKRNNLRLPEDNEKLTIALNKFEQLKNSPTFTGEKDIQKYDPAKLYETTREDEGVSNKAKVKNLIANGGSGAVLSGHNPDTGVKLFKVTDPQQAVTLSSNTSWCTNLNEGQVAERYLKTGPLWVIYKGDKPYAQMHGRTRQFMDVNDRSVKFNDPVIKEAISMLPDGLASKQSMQKRVEISDPNISDEKFLKMIQEDRLLSNWTRNNLKVPSKILIPFLKSIGSRGRYDLAIRSNELDQDTIEELLRDPDRNIRGALGWRTRDPELIKKLAKDPHFSVRQVAAYNNNVPIDSIRYLIDDKSSTVRERMAMRKDISAEDLNKLSKDKSESVIIAVANNTKTPPNIFEDLYHNSEGEAIKRAIIWNKNAPSSVLKYAYYHQGEGPGLISHASWGISINPNTPSYILGEMIENEIQNPKEYTGALGNPNAPSHLIEKASHSNDINLRARVAENPNVRDFEMLSRDSEQRVRYHLTENPGVPASILRRMADEDEDFGVRGSAKYRLERRDNPQE